MKDILGAFVHEHQGIQFIYSYSGSGQGLVAGCCERGDEPSGSCATELVS
jgi:hypothetical protein